MARVGLLVVTILLVAGFATPLLAADPASEPERASAAAPDESDAAPPAPPRIVMERSPVSQRERVLVGAFLMIIAGSVASFGLGGRVSQRVHVALALCNVLVAGFALLILFGSSGGGGAATLLIFLGMLGLFKLMNQFEIVRKAR